MAKIEKSIEIEAPVEEVWPVVHWDRVTEWMDFIKNAEYTSEKHHEKGATAHVISEVAGQETEFDTEYTDYVENERKSWRTTGGDMTAFGEVSVEPTEEGTKVNLSMDYELPYSILGKIMDKLKVSKEMEKEYETALEKLKDMLEQ
ncbi:SRPBCC family protein [Candidatus Bipolaricaulota bacterium]|nr:SRPBCC family protein [Candidatus Bipolaricaulota bacterium]